MTPTLQALPANWGSRDQAERLTPAAAASLSRVMMRAVAETDSHFNINDAYRSYDEQVSLFKANYRNRGTRSKRHPSDRMFGGTAWRHVTDVAVASPDLYGTGTGANHTKGLAIDVVPAAIQNYLRNKGLASGWSWAEGERNNEPWHFTYEEARDQYRSEGYLDHAAVQRVVGAEVDGKIGPATAKKIREWQKAHGLEADGKVGKATKKAMGLSGKAESAPASASSAPASLTLADLPEIETGKTSPNANEDRKGHSVKHVTVHWWGTPSGQSFDGIVDWLCNPDANVSAHYVISPTRVARIVDEEHRSWANGNGVANSESITIECDPNDVLGTLPVLAALIKDIRSRWGDLPVYPHQHWTSTECPGDYLPHLGAVDLLARTGKAVVAAAPTKAKAKSGIDEDGRWGTETSKALQSLLGTTRDGRMGPDTWRALQKRLNQKVGAGILLDGLIENQSYKPEELGNGISPNGWEYTGRNSKGSKTIRALQKLVGAGQDGVLYEGTTLAVQRALNAGRL